MLAFLVGLLEASRDRRNKLRDGPLVNVVHEHNTSALAVSRCEARLVP